MRIWIDRRNIWHTLCPPCKADTFLLGCRLIRTLDVFDRHIARMVRAVDDIRLMDTQPSLSTVPLGSVLAEARQAIHAGREATSGRSIDIYIDPALDNIHVIADPRHLRLVFANLLDNSLRATETVGIALVAKGTEREYVERVSVSCTLPVDRNHRLER